MEYNRGVYVECEVCKTELHKQDGTKKYCSGCKKIHYCSKKCQVAHWPTHKHVCKTLKESKAMLTLTQVRKDAAKRDDIFYSSRPLSERVKWGDMSPSDPDTLRVQRFIRNLDKENLHAFSATKWISSGLRGGVLYDLDAPLPTAGGVDMYPWFTWDGFQRTRDRRMQEIVKGYDPAYEAPVFIYKIDQPGISLKIWPHIVKTGSLPVCLRPGGKEIDDREPVAALIAGAKEIAKAQEWIYVIEE